MNSEGQILARGQISEVISSSKIDCEINFSHHLSDTQSFDWNILRHYPVSSDTKFNSSRFIFYIQIASDVLHRYFSHFRFHKFVYPFQSAINFKFTGHEKVHTDLYKSFQIYFNIKNELYILFISFYANQCFTKLVPRIRSSTVET